MVRHAAPSPLSKHSLSIRFASTDGTRMLFQSVAGLRVFAAQADAAFRCRCASRLSV